MKNTSFLHRCCKLASIDKILKLKREGDGRLDYNELRTLQPASLLLNNCQLRPLPPFRVIKYAYMGVRVWSKSTIYFQDKTEFNRTVEWILLRNEDLDLPSTG